MPFFLYEKKMQQMRAHSCLVTLHTIDFVVGVDDIKQSSRLNSSFFSVCESFFFWMHVCYLVEFFFLHNFSMQAIVLRVSEVSLCFFIWLLNGQSVVTFKQCVYLLQLITITFVHVKCFNAYTCILFSINLINVQ